MGEYWGNIGDGWGAWVVLRYAGESDVRKLEISLSGVRECWGKGVWLAGGVGVAGL